MERTMPTLSRQQMAAVILGLAASAVGFGLAFGIMAQRAQAGTDYHWWSWWAIPLYWGPSALASLIVPVRPRIASAVLLYVAITGSLFFADVYGYAAGAPLALAGLLAFTSQSFPPEPTPSMEGDTEDG